MSAASKKPAKVAPKTAKPDIDKPGKSAPTATSKPVIVSNRPLLKDPMVVDEDVVSKNEDADKEELAHSTGPKLTPLEKPAQAENSSAADRPTKEQQPEPEPVPEEKMPKQEEVPPEPDTKPEQKAEAKAAEQAKHEADIQKLIESRRYELPINAVEKRKTKRFVVLGVILVIILALAWADTALDAGLIQINGVKPITHFFSN